MIETGLKDKVVLITGANHGIGAATAKAFAAQGAAVFITYLCLPLEATDPGGTETNEASVPGESFYRRQQAENADAVVQAIRQRSGRAEAWEADLADAAVIPHLFDQVEATFGPVDVLVNNAAHCRADTFLPQRALGSDRRNLEGMGFLQETITAESHDQHFTVNSRAVALMMAEFAKRHIAQEKPWGRIINVSTDGASGFTGEVSYGASKHALESYSRAAASELGRFGITVNVISLGAVQTGWISPELEQREASSMPLRCIGQPADVAVVILFFASEQARWVTGQLLYVGGGHVMPL